MAEMLQRIRSVTRLYVLEDGSYVLAEELEDVIIPPGEMRFNRLIVTVRETEIPYNVVKNQIVLDRSKGVLYNDLYMIPD